MAALAGRNAVSVRHESFRSDADRLLAEIEPILRPGATPGLAAQASLPTAPEAVDPIDVIAALSAVRVLRHAQSVNGVAFSPDGELLATACADRTARVSEVASGQERARVTHGDAVRRVAFSPDGRLLATASNDNTAQIWRLVR
jgi:WD40 repeat protein